ncbi:hypothetical protein FNV43_RR17656 [Rhamnella rubrinervis]|uniref:Uncharacterized protein n=1 Tax=Rhamnella rubrinervis TaxID=2594499 RepID=A0A8K0E455_9ROSA|nr:hypothetical protein FNV43_RR17656 [Rhamnella rubrinervis]
MRFDSRVDVPKPKEFKARDAKELDNRGTWNDTEGLTCTTKQSKAYRFLYFIDLAWWRRKHEEMRKGGSSSTSWIGLQLWASQLQRWGIQDIHRLTMRNSWIIGESSNSAEDDHDDGEEMKFHKSTRQR